MIMLDPKSLFLIATLGEEGAFALEKALTRYPVLEDVLLPRTVLSWVELASKASYVGGIPGISGTSIELTKSESGISGKISFNDQKYEFINETPYHVTAATICVLGLDKPINPISHNKIADLGKSLDLMVKAKVAINTLEKVGGAGGGAKGAEKPGPAAVPLAPKAPEPPVATAPTAPKPKKMGVGPQMGQAAPTGMKPIKTANKPGMGLPKVNKPGIMIKKSHLGTVCAACDQKQFKGAKFVGCVCFADLAKSVAVTPIGEDYKLTFGEGWSIEDLRELVKNFG